MKFGWTDVNSRLNATERSHDATRLLWRYSVSSSLVSNSKLCFFLQKLLFLSCRLLVSSSSSPSSSSLVLCCLSASCIYTGLLPLLSAARSDIIHVFSASDQAAWKCCPVIDDAVCVDNIKQVDAECLHESTLQTCVLLCTGQRSDYDSQLKVRLRGFRGADLPF